MYAQHTEKQLTGLRFILKRSYSCITQIEKKSLHIAPLLLL